MSEPQTVVFNLNGNFYGAEASQVLQIIRYQGVTEYENMPELIDGVADYRGIELPLINLNKRFELGEPAVTKKTRILVTKIYDKLAGFIVDDISEIMKFTKEEIEPAPALILNSKNTYLSRVGKKGDKLIAILDLGKVLNDNEIGILNVKAE